MNFLSSLKKHQTSVSKGKSRFFFLRWNGGHRTGKQIDSESHWTLWI